MSEVVRHHSRRNQRSRLQVDRHVVLAVDIFLRGYGLVVELFNSALVRCKSKLYRDEIGREGR